MVQHMGQSPVGSVWNFGNIAMVHSLWIQTWRECKEYSEYKEGSTVDRSTEKAVQWIEVQRRQYSGEKYKEGSTVDRSTKKAVKWIEVQRRQYIG